MDRFELVTDMAPAGDQPQAIARLTEGLRAGRRHQVLLGVTGSGKTFTMAHVIQNVQRPTLVISHNKTLAAQLYREFAEFFPHNAVGYFVSYYDYYQPEAYIPQRDLYIEKDASINEHIDRLRLRCTSHLLTRRDVIIVASVSCIYGLGAPEDFKEMFVHLRVGAAAEREEVLKRLVVMQYERTDTDLVRGKFRVRGDVLEIHPSTEEAAYRVELFGDEVDRIAEIDPVSGEERRRLEDLIVYPAKHFVMPDTRLEAGIERIKQELAERLEELRREGKLLEAQRLEARTLYDIELMTEFGYCPGIENYSRPLAGRPPGSRPYTLVDYFPEDYLLIVDESHVTLPQLGAMYKNDRTRKETLVEHGFRLPSALDNRPMTFEEWEQAVGQVIYVSATPGEYELRKAEGEVVEQVIRPTGLVDPVIRVRPARDQVAELLEEIEKRVAVRERVLVTTLTKRMSEDLTEYLRERGVKVAYLHSEIDAIERVEILNNLRRGAYDVIVGVNLLREGLDLPEVSLVCIMDADKEGFLRSATALIQTIGRTARNINAEVILFGDTVTEAMRQAIEETRRRRAIQEAYNREHAITPETVRKAIRRGIEEELGARETARLVVGESEEVYLTRDAIAELEEEMHQAARELDFERAAELRDRIIEYQRRVGLTPEKVFQPRKAREKARARRARRGAFPRKWHRTV